MGVKVCWSILNYRNTKRYYISWSQISKQVCMHVHNYMRGSRGWGSWKFMKAYEIHLVNLPKKGLGHPPPPFRQTLSEKNVWIRAWHTNLLGITYHGNYLHGIYLRICHLKCKVSLHKLSQIIINEMIWRLHIRVSLMNN